MHLAAVFTFSRFIFIQDIWYSPRPPLNHSHIKVEKNFRSRPSPPHLHAEKTRPPVKVTEWKHESTTLLIEPGHAARKKKKKTSKTRRERPTRGCQTNNQASHRSHLIVTRKREKACMKRGPVGIASMYRDKRKADTGVI